MPLQKLQFRPGMNREGTNYSNEGGWYDGDKVRFRSGFPEKIGGWTQVSPDQFIGICRSLWVWQDADSGAGNDYIGVGTSAKYYIYFAGAYNNITPIYETSVRNNPFTTTLGSRTITVTDPSVSPSEGDWIQISNSVVVAGLELNGNYQVRAITGATTYTFEAPSPASSAVTGGGTGVVIEYEYPAGNNVFTIGTGWGAGPWGGTSPIPTNLGNNPFAAANGFPTVTVTQNAHGYSTGNYVTFSGATAFAGFTTGQLNNTYQITVVSVNTYTITLSTLATSTASGGGASVVANLQPYGWGTEFLVGTGQQLRLWSNSNYGSDLVIAPRGGPVFYWTDIGTVSERAKYLSDIADDTVSFSDPATFGTTINAGSFVIGSQYKILTVGTTNFTLIGAASNTVGVTFTATGVGSGSGTATLLQNFITISIAATALVYPYMFITGTNIPPNTQVGPSYDLGSTTVPITNFTDGASSGLYDFSFAGAYVPKSTYQVLASSIQRFVICLGANPYDPSNPNNEFNPMLVRWSDQENPYQWILEANNQAGEFPLTNGSFIMAARTTRQEILVWTDSCLYSMQYLGPPFTWGFQVLMDNISVISPNSMITASNVTYWMGRDRFYMYSGRVEVLPCALRQYVFGDLNQEQAYQITCGSNEAYNEVWWFYVSNSSNGNIVDKYVIYNYLDRVWYYGTLNRTAWLQAGTLQYPIAADYNGRLLFHENGCDDQSTGVTMPIYSYIQSSDFDISDGHNFGFVWRMLPDINFNNSRSNQPQVTLTVRPRVNSGTPYGSSDNTQVRSAQNYIAAPQYTIQEFTGQVYTRLRGRQLAFRIESNEIGVAWQLGSPRIDIRPDGRR